jgi:hypothetical protein
MVAMRAAATNLADIVTHELTLGYVLASVPARSADPDHSAFHGPGLFAIRFTACRHYGCKIAWAAVAIWVLP